MVSETAQRVFNYAMVMMVLIVNLIFIECVYFYCIYNRKHSIEKSDAIVVFNGHKERVETACKLYEEGFAPYLIVSPADSNELKYYNLNYSNKKSFKFIVEEKARSTFENALYVDNLIRLQQYQSIILVTSLYHLPRSLFLLKAVGFGYPLKINIFLPTGNNSDFKEIIKSSKGISKIYSELIKMWGSIIELGYFKLTGKLFKSSLNNTCLMRE